MHFHVPILTIVLIIVVMTVFSSVVSNAVYMNRFAVENLSLHFSSQQNSASTGVVTRTVVPIATSAREKALRAALAMQQGQLEQAIAGFAEAIQSSKSSERSDMWRLQLAQAYFAAGQKEEAQQLIVQISKFQLGAYARCMTFLWRKPNIEEAGLWCPLLEKGQGLTAQEECWSLGAYYLLAYQRDAAETVFTRASAKPDIDASCMRYFANSYYYRYKDYAQASRYSRLAIELDPNDVYTYWLLAASERHLQHPENAVETYWAMEQRLSGSSDHLEWRHEFAAYLLELGRGSEAQQVYRSILQDVPDDQTAREALKRLE